MVATPDQREPLGFGEFRFCMDRMRRNCKRLAVGSVRSLGPFSYGSRNRATQPSSLGGEFSASEDSDGTIEDSNLSSMIGTRR